LKARIVDAILRVQPGLNWAREAKMNDFLSFGNGVEVRRVDVVAIRIRRPFLTHAVKFIVTWIMISVAFLAFTVWHVDLGSSAELEVYFETWTGYLSTLFFGVSLLLLIGDAARFALDIGADQNAWRQVEVRTRDGRSVRSRLMTRLAADKLVVSLNASKNNEAG
jgi:hypothetical protein